MNTKQTPSAKGVSMDRLVIGFKLIVGVGFIVAALYFRPYDIDSFLLGIAGLSLVPVSLR